MINIKNSYLDLPSTFYSKEMAAPLANPTLIAFNDRLSQDLGFGFETLNNEELTNIFSGQKVLKDSTPIALAYSGFQFGHPNPNLGDGRALLLGEINRFDIQLKGSGQTLYSRRGDGKSALGPVLREYIVSEAMHVLGVPTTRALAAVATNESVFRQFGPEPGGIFTRVASSHLRVGTFQFFAFRKDIANLKILLEYSIKRHFKDLISISDPSEMALEFLKSFARKQGDLIAKWSSLGFVHGVMNTDNCAIDGITIDYGPCAFLEEFKFNKVFSSIDREGRYSFFNQVPIIQWNILRLADCLIPLIDPDEKIAIKKIEDSIFPIFGTFEELRFKAFARKMGITNYEEKDKDLVLHFLTFLDDKELDFTQSFRELKTALDGNNVFFEGSSVVQELFAKINSRRDVSVDLDLINPIFIPRNHLVQRAIDLAYDGDFSFFNEMLTLIKNPFTKYDKFNEYYRPAAPAEKVVNTYCGT